MIDSIFSKILNVCTTVYIKDAGLIEEFFLSSENINTTNDLSHLTLFYHLAETSSRFKGIGDVFDWPWSPIASKSDISKTSVLRHVSIIGKRLQQKYKTNCLFE